MVNLNHPTRAWNHTGGATFSGCHRVIVTDLVAQERKFVANSRLKKAEKINFSWNLVAIKTVLLLPFFLKDPVVGYSKDRNLEQKIAQNWVTWYKQHGKIALPEALFILQFAFKQVTRSVLVLTLLAKVFKACFACTLYIVQKASLKNSTDASARFPTMRTNQRAFYNREIVQDVRKFSLNPLKLSITKDFCIPVRNLSSVGDFGAAAV